MKKVLWLPSWYPNKLFPFNGDFIQRHAAAAALYQPVQVIHIVKDEKGIQTKKIMEDMHVAGGLSETIVYYKPFVTGIAVVDKLISSARYISIYKASIKRYIDQQGRPGVIHVHVPFKAGILARWCKKKYDIPFIVTEHWCAYNNLNPDNFFVHNALFRSTVKKIFQSASLVTPVCESNRKELTDLFDIKKSVVVCNVADDRLFYLPGDKPELPFTFIHVSSLSRQKNVEGILHAFSVLKNNIRHWQCIIVGPYNTSLVQQAKLLGLEKFIQWTGELPYESVARHTRNAHSMVMFSRYENSPCTIIEALTAGIPVIASSVGGIPEIIDEQNGLLVASEDIDALAGAMAKMIDGYGRYRCSGIAEKAKRMFSYEAIGLQITSLYREFEEK